MNQIQKSIVISVLIATSAFFADTAFAINAGVLDVEKDLQQNAHHVDSPILSPNGALTIESWVNFESLPTAGSHRTIVGKWTTSCCTRSYEFFAYESFGQIFLHAAISSDGSAVPGSYLTLDKPYNFIPGTWYHVAFVFEPGARMELYVNGISIGSVESGVPLSIFDNTAEFQVGADIDDTGVNNFFDGQLDDVRLWGIVRSQAEINLTMNQELLGDEVGLLGYWKFNGNATDSSPNTLHLSLRNGPTFVPELNHAPVLEPIGNKVVSEGQLITFTVSAYDVDGDALAYSATNLPEGAVFDTQTGVFSWVPSYDQEGNYNDVEFSVIDDGSPIELDIEFITITVGDVNRAPQFFPIAPQSILEEHVLSFAVNAIDPDNHGVLISSPNLPDGATFIDGNFLWIPTLEQSGDYVVTFISIDTGIPPESSVINVVLTVGDNPTPIEQSIVIVDTITAFEFTPSIENSYLAHMKKVEKFIQDGRITPAVKQLLSLRSKIESDYSTGLIGEGVRDDLISRINTLLSALEM